jgi:uncharacterized membrane protein YeaQ/YmgE (transglycosylase-associated protein family)
MDVLNIIVWLLIGIVAGLVTTLITETKTAQGMVLDIVVGLIGGFVGGFVLSLLNAMGTGVIVGINISGAAVALIGAAILLIIFEALRRSSE